MNIVRPGPTASTIGKGIHALINRKLVNNNVYIHNTDVTSKLNNVGHANLILSTNPGFHVIAN